MTAVWTCVAVTAKGQNVSTTGLFIHPHPKQLHHQLPVLLILVFVLLFDLL